MPNQEDENKPKVETPTGPETPEQAAVRAAGAVQAGKEKDAAAALVGAETEAPTMEHAKEDPAEKAREITQKYLETIPESDRRLTDPKQVERLLYVLEESDKPSRDLFAPTDKLGNMPRRVFEAFNKGDVKGVIQGWREFADDPVGVSKETDKVDKIANSTLPESVRTALLSIILKEGDHSAMAMAKEAAEILEQTGDITALKPLREKYSSPEAFKSTALRQGSARELLKGLYPDLVESGEMALLSEMKSLSLDQARNKDVVVVMVERYSQLAGDAAFSRQYREVGNASNAREVLSKLQDGSIAEKDAGRVLPVLQRELRQVIAKKATSA